MSATRLTLFFREIPLGFLERTEKGYRYTSYPENEQIAYDLLLANDYSLWHSIRREKKILFAEFEQILQNCRRKDIVEDSGILDTDSRWEKLSKLAALQWFTPNLYVQHTTDIDEERCYHEKRKGSAGGEE